MASRNSVTPMVAARLTAEGVARLPAHVARALRLGYEINALRTHHLAACAAEIADCFASAGVPAMALKGPALAISAYGDLAMRVFADLDFMVRVEDLPRAAASAGAGRLFVAVVPCRHRRERILSRRVARFLAPGQRRRSPLAPGARVLPVWPGG